MVRGRVPGLVEPNEKEEGGGEDSKKTRLFHDDTLKTFYRRLTFSPDGQLLIAPSGVIQPPDPQDKLTNVTWLFPKGNFSL
jgi:chromatin assembly factor 1 subunit B